MATMTALHAFLPILSGSWDVPFTAQEECARIVFMTTGEGAKTLLSVQPYAAKYVKLPPAPLMAPLVETRAHFVNPHPSTVTPPAPLMAPLAFIAHPPPLELMSPSVPEVSVAESVSKDLSEPVAESVSVEKSLTCEELEASLETPLQMVMKALRKPLTEYAKPLTEYAKHNANGIKTVVVRNLPRDIKDYELRPLFAAHTTNGLRDLYIPRNTDKASPYYGTLKGFALVKFHTAEESTSAFLANQSLCIRGKNIALEFAKEDRAF